MAFNHGAILRRQGQRTEAVRLLIGHPLIASRMTRVNVGSAIYAPLSLLVAANANGGTTLEYDRPSTLFGQFHDRAVDEVARELDEKVAVLVELAAKP